MRVVPTSVSNVVTTLLSDVIKTLPQCCCIVAIKFSIGFLGRFTIDYSDFFPFIETRITKVLIGIKHTSSLFKGTLYLQLTKVYTNQVKYTKFNFFTINRIIHFFPWIDKLWSFNYDVQQEEWGHENLGNFANSYG